MSTLLGPPIAYIDILDDDINKKNSESSTKPRVYNPLRPSSAGKCAFELVKEYAQFKGLLPASQTPISPELSRIFEMGHGIEWSLLKRFEQVPDLRVKYRQQVVRFFQLSDGTWVEGSIDATMFATGYSGVCGDVKSKKDRLSGFAATGWDEFNEGLAKMKSVEKINDRLFWINDLDAFLTELKDPWLAPNFIQLNLYSNTEFIKQCGIDHGAVWQFNKNDSRLRELRFRPSEKVYEATKNKLNSVHDAVSEQLGLPEEKRDLSFSKLRCAPVTLCRHCWEAESLAAYYATLPPKQWPKDTSYMGKTGQELEAAYTQYLEAQTIAGDLTQIEEQLVKTIEASGQTKIKFSDGNVYQIKLLKTPKPHLALRRSK